MNFATEFVSGGGGGGDIGGEGGGFIGGGSGNNGSDITGYMLNSHTTVESGGSGVSGGGRGIADEGGTIGEEDTHSMSSLFSRLRSMGGRSRGKLAGDLTPLVLALLYVPHHHLALVLCAGDPPGGKTVILPLHSPTHPQSLIASTDLSFSVFLQVIVPSPFYHTLKPPRPLSLFHTSFQQIYPSQHFDNSSHSKSG